MIHIASDAGIWGEQSIGLYSVSKAAVVMLVLGLGALLVARW